MLLSGRLWYPLRREKPKFMFKYSLLKKKFLFETFLHNLPGMFSMPVISLSTNDTIFSTTIINH